MYNPIGGDAYEFIATAHRHLRSPFAAFLGGHASLPERGVRDTREEAGSDEDDERNDA